ncbi:SGNH/GDSL hydrolase N-terminal domain-containing protein [Paenibacillus thiaminolyticus]|uniref:SGNH/GDSL hydrolase N-terminal domain-containing protein n=1 Tax=Paenibacillus thiaminolyticus TaxID=49283 RepID=UPI0021757B6D|nr:SGNH/GDSL hydrolase N-terminal domain-containing protein [Paenibacillus thiaminolyticus]
MHLEQNGLVGLQWLSPTEKPFRLSGFSWFEQEQLFRRLPLRSLQPIPPVVDVIANHTAGGQLAFQTSSRQLAIAYNWPIRPICIICLPPGNAGLIFI